MACGCYAAFVDFHATEVHPTLLVIFAGSFGLGLFAPGKQWRWAILVAVWLPAIHMAAFAFQDIESAQPHPYLSRFMMLVPASLIAFLGAYAGAFGRFIRRRI